MRAMTTTVLALALFGAQGITSAKDAMTEAQVRAQLEAQGYTNIDDVEFDDGMWKADARSADGKDIDLRIDGKTGTIYPETAVSRLTEAEVHARLSAAGYTAVHDVEFDDGMWKADATNASGVEVDLHIDPASGEVVGKDRD